LSLRLRAVQCSSSEVQFPFSVLVIGGRSSTGQPGPGAPWWGDARGRIPLARRRPGRREMSEGARVRTRTTCGMPPHQPTGIAKRAVSIEGVLNAGTTNGTPVVYHGSSLECLRRQGGVAPLTPGGRSTLGLSYRAVSARTWFEPAGQTTIQQMHLGKAPCRIHVVDSVWHSVRSCPRGTGRRAMTVGDFP